MEGAMQKPTAITGVMFMVVAALAGCAPVAEHQANLASAQDRNLTVGVVQKEIHKGMDQAAVAQALGSPNIVSKDKDGLETWIYDKISSEVSYSKSDAYGTLLLIGGSKASGAASSSQKTLTIVIKFSEGLVSEFVYHTSTF
jgi:outer membrane protein assembly factor BamE (lipoprotein component of BamABCDE complex)